MAKTIPFHGTVAVGNSKSDAIAQYRALAKGKDASLFVDKGRSLSFVSNSTVLAQMFNPLTGNMDMGEAPELIKSLSFASESSTEKREVNHYECKAGCGGHIVYDSDDLLKFCPVCTTVTASDDLEDEDSDEVTGDEDTTDAEGDLDLGDDDEEVSEDGEEDAEAKAKVTAKSSKAKTKVSKSDDDEGADEEDDEDEDGDTDMSDTTENAGDSSDAETAEDAEDEEDAEAKAKVTAKAKSAKPATKPAKFKVKSISADDLTLDDLDDTEDSLDEDADADADLEVDDEEVEEDAEAKAKVTAKAKVGVKKPAKVKAKTVKAADDADEGADEEEADLDEELDDTEAMGEDDADEEDDSAEIDEPVVVAAATKKKAIALYMKERPATAAKSVEVDYKVCTAKDCGAHVLSEVSLSECPACQGKLGEPVAMAEDEEIDLEEDLSDMDDAQEGDADLNLLEEDEGEELDADLEEEDVEATAKAKPAKKPAKAKVFKLKSISADDLGDDVVEDEDLETEDLLADEGEEDFSEDEDLDIDAMDQIDDEAEDADEDLDVSYSSAIKGRSQWTAFYKGIPVAVCTAATAGKNADIFDTPDFGKATVISAKHAGVKNTLREMGFKPLITTIALSAVINKKVKTKVASVGAKVKRERAEYAERLKASLATAAVGLTRNFFVDLQNPLKTSLRQALSTAGVRNPEVLIHQAFKTSADAYHKVLFDKAADIMSKPAEVQESLAKAVLETNYSSESSESGSTSTEDRLASLGHSVKTSQSNDTSASQDESTSSVASGTFSEQASRVVGTLGRHGRW